MTLKIRSILVGFFLSYHYLIGAGFYIQGMRFNELTPYTFEREKDDLVGKIYSQGNLFWNRRYLSIKRRIRIANLPEEKVTEEEVLAKLESGLKQLADSYGLKFKKAEGTFNYDTIMTLVSDDENDWVNKTVSLFIDSNNKAIKIGRLSITDLFEFSEYRKVISWVDLFLETDVESLRTLVKGYESSLKLNYKTAQISVNTLEVLYASLKDKAKLPSVIEFGAFEAELIFMGFCGLNYHVKIPYVSISSNLAELSELMTDIESYKGSAYFYTTNRSVR